MIPSRIYSGFLPEIAALPVTLSRHCVGQGPSQPDVNKPECHTGADPVDHFIEGREVVILVDLGPDRDEFIEITRVHYHNRIQSSRYPIP